MTKIEWKTGKPPKDGVYLTTLEFPEGERWAVLTRLEGGIWQTAGEITAWDYRPEPYNPHDEMDNPFDFNFEEDDEEGCSEDDLEWQVKDLEAAWSEIHGEMKYYEGASEALLNVIKLLI